MKHLCFHLIISFLCSASILLYYKYPSLANKHLKNHLIIFLLKLLIISMFIYFFINNFRGSDFRILIVSGYSNLAILHIIEGFLVQKIIKENDIRK